MLLPLFTSPPHSSHEAVDIESQPAGAPAEVGGERDSGRQQRDNHRR